MRKLSFEKRELVLSALIEGLGVRAAARLCRVDKKTVLRLLCDIGLACDRYHDAHVRNLKTTRIEVDECWAFVGCKRSSVHAGKKGAGDVWVWCGLDSDTRLVISYRTGTRGTKDALRFISDLSERISGRVQLSSDAHPAYAPAIRRVFGDRIDWARVMKVYRKAEYADERRYSPPQCVGCDKESVVGSPDLSTATTSYTERQNLNLRIFNRRHTRLTNGFSRKVVNHAHSVSLHYFAHNFLRRCATLKKTPAQAAELTDRQWTVADLVRILEVEEDKECFGPVGSRINRADRP